MDGNARRKKASKIFYLHIPKTGGQTLATRLASAFPIGETDIIGQDLAYPQGGEELRALLRTKSFIERHVRGPVLADFPELNIICTVREPAAQIASNYLHILREPANYLHRAAKILSMPNFFSQFGDLLSNHQTRCLISAFLELDVDPLPLRTWSIKMFDALSRVCWAVPTECIDEFVTFWSLETGRHIPSAKVTVNVSPKDQTYHEILDVVRQMPELFSLDLLLWQVTRQRYAAYRDDVTEAKLSPVPANDHSRAYWNSSSGLWLRRGWYSPQEAGPTGIAWWAGPGQYSEIFFRRKPDERYVLFWVIVVCGVPYTDIHAVGSDRTTKLSLVRRDQDSYWEFLVDLRDQPIQGSFWLWVPDVWSPVMVDQTTNDTDRKSFATCNWRLEKEGYESNR